MFARVGESCYVAHDAAHDAMRTSVLAGAPQRARGGTQYTTATRPCAGACAGLFWPTANANHFRWFLPEFVPASAHACVWKQAHRTTSSLRRDYKSTIRLLPTDCASGTCLAYQSGKVHTGAATGLPPTNQSTWNVQMYRVAPGAKHQTSAVLFEATRASLPLKTGSSMLSQFRIENPRVAAIAR